MDYVYLCRDGDNEELRYSIRSVVKNANPNAIWVIGGKPDWYSGNFIEVIQDKNKFENQVKSLKEVCKNNKISDEFILMNDDFYILQSVEEYKYSDGLLTDKLEKHVSLYGNSSYARALRGALKTLIAMGIKQPINYEVHMPMALEKANLAKVLDLSLSPRSMYGNLFIRDSINCDDVKIYKDSIDINFNQSLMSTEDNSFSLIKNKLKELFPDASEFEKE
jgi:hypothetical protein